MSEQGNRFGDATRRTFLAGATMAAAAGAFPFAAGAASGKAPVATTKAGRVRGAMDGGTYVFRGVPYGAPTGGKNRFRAPQPVAPWKGIRDATRYGPASPQHPDQAFDNRPDAAAPSEDCLMVNVWTPGLEPDAKRPVMVWFHGGALAVGSGQEYVNDGANLARRQDVVLVTVNHRLNAFGYLYFGDLVAPGEADANVGQQDLVAALRWVRDNIAGFGGDPGNVTIFGQSGGGRKVSAVMAMPSARGLFHKAILQSGFGTAVEPLEGTQAIAGRLFDALGLARGDIAGLRALSTERIQEGFWAASNGVPLRASNLVIDGEVLPRVPFIAGDQTPAPDVPVLMGHTATEATVLFPPPEAFGADWDTVARLLGQGTPMMGVPAPRELAPLIAGFRRIMPEASPSEVYFAIATEMGMGRNARMVADNRVETGTAPVYRYVVNWRTSAQGGKLLSPHGVELPMVFDTADQPFGTIENNRAEYQRMADVVSAMWAQFARTGNPARPGLPEWPAYHIGERAMMVIDDTSAARIDPLGPEQALIAAYF